MQRCCSGAWLTLLTLLLCLPVTLPALADRALPSEFSAGAVTESAPPLRSIQLSGIEKNEFNVLTGNIIKEAYRRLGIRAEIEYLPGGRALAKSSSGAVDGEVSRIFRVGDTYQSLVRVPVPFLSLKGAVFTLDPEVKVRSPEDLSKYTSGVLRGIVYSDQLTQGSPRVFGRTVSHLFELLLAGRVDLVIVTELSGRIVLAREFADAGIRIENPALVQIPVYHYLHQSQRQLVPQMTATLQQMYQSRETLEMKEAYIQERIGRR